MKKEIISIIVAGIWITFSEFIRNELLLRDFWAIHFKNLGLTFQTLPINGLLWIIWSFALSSFIYLLLKKFSFKETIIVSWIVAFLMMWIVLFNLQVLPIYLLIFAVPLSLLEIILAAIIIKKLK